MKDSDEMMSQEREFIESLLNTRANFSLVVFGLAIAGATAIEIQWLQIMILGSSTIISTLLALATSRAQWKLDLIFRMLPKTHPAKKVDEEAKKIAKTDKLGFVCKCIVGKSRRHYIGYVIPWFTVMLLFAGCIAASCGAFIKEDKIVSQSANSRSIDSMAVSLRKVSSRLDTLELQINSKLPVESNNNNEIKPYTMYFACPYIPLNTDIVFW